MSKRSAVAAFCALLISASACTASRVGPDQKISVSGTILRHGAKPAADARVSLLREPDVGDVFVTVASIGLVCLTESARPAVCRKAKLTSSNGRGSFSYELTGKDTQATLGTSAVMALNTAIDPKREESEGPNSTYRFHVQTEKLELPVRIWEPSLAGRTGSFGARVTFGRVPAGLLPAPLSSAPFRYSIAFSRGDEPVWTIDRATPISTFDPRVLEDSTGTMRVVALANDVDVSESLGDEVALAMRSGSRAYASPVPPPVSRGAQCAVADARGRTAVQAPCRLTDGTFARDFAPAICTAPGCTEPAHTAAVVNLPRRVSVDLIVVRGCSSSCRVETSLDGRAWRLAGVAGAERAALRLSPARPLRFVRVAGNSVDRLTEVSAWTGLPRLPDASFLVAPARFPTGGGTTPKAAGPDKGSKSGFNVWLLVATGLFGAVAGLFVGLVARRRRRVR